MDTLLCHQLSAFQAVFCFQFMCNMVTHSLPVLKTSYLLTYWLSVLWPYSSLPLRKLFLQLPELWRGSNMGMAEGYFRPIDSHTYVSVPCCSTEKWGSLLFPRICLEKKKSAGSFHSQSSLSAPQVADVSIAWIWQLSVDNGGGGCISGPLSGIHRRLRTFFSLFLLPITS